MAAADHAGPDGDLYQLLGVPREASREEIAQAWRRRARDEHPDARPADADAPGRFRALAGAWRVLGDPARSAGGTRRYSRRDIEKLAEICALTADGLNLAGIRRVLALQEETRQMQAELSRLRELAGGQPAARPARQPRPRPGSGA